MNFHHKDTFIMGIPIPVKTILALKCDPDHHVASPCRSVSKSGRSCAWKRRSPAQITSPSVLPWESLSRSGPGRSLGCPWTPSVLTMVLLSLTPGGGRYLLTRKVGSLLTLDVQNFFLKKHKNLFAFKMVQIWDGADNWNPPMEDKGSFILQIQYHGCWWPGNKRSQGISGPEYFTFSTRRVDLIRLS